MKISQDISSPRLLKIKGILFAILGLTAGCLLILSDPTVQTILLLSITVWAFCRFYYFLFYVLEHYAGSERPYAGILDALKSLIRK